jgi:hypothetical protein
MNNLGLWYFIIAAFVLVVTSFYFVRGKVFNLFDDVLCPATLFAVAWPLIAIVFIIAIIFGMGLLPLYAFYTMLVYLINKKIIKK